MTDRAVRRPASAARSFWGALPLLTLIIMIGPVLAGLLGTVLPAFGYLPAAGLGAFSVTPFTDLFRWNGIWAATRLSVTTGFAATFLSLAIVTLLMALVRHPCLSLVGNTALSAAFRPTRCNRLWHRLPDRPLGLDRPHDFALVDRLGQAP